MGTAASVRRGGSDLSGTVSRHAEGWYWGKVLTLVIGANEFKPEGSTVDPGRTGRVVLDHSSDSHIETWDRAVDELEVDTWDATSEKTEEVDDEADDEREEAYG
jgi:hypothetical protein